LGQCPKKDTNENYKKIKTIKYSESEFTKLNDLQDKTIPLIPKS
jgi:hypothetical protein